MSDCPDISQDLKDVAKKRYQAQSPSPLGHNIDINITAAVSDNEEDDENMKDRGTEKSLTKREKKKLKKEKKKKQKEEEKKRKEALASESTQRIVINEDGVARETPEPPENEEDRAPSPKGIFSKEYNRFAQQTVST